MRGDAHGTICKHGVCLHVGRAVRRVEVSLGRIPNVHACHLLGADVGLLIDFFVSRNAVA